MKVSRQTYFLNCPLKTCIIDFHHMRAAHLTTGIQQEKYYGKTGGVTSFTWVAVHTGLGPVAHVCLTVCTNVA